MKRFYLGKMRMVGELGNVEPGAEIEVNQRHVVFVDQDFADLVDRVDVLTFFGVGGV